jgi:predicted outer membrane repeat protein
VHNNGYYTEQNQKAEFYGGAIAAGCGLIVFGGIILFVIAAYLSA